MNINGFPSQISSSRSLGSQLDITLNGISKPQNVSTAGSVQTQSQVGTISGVLSDEENLAISTIFQKTVQNLYNVSGNTQTTRMIPGLHLDMQA